MKDLFARSNMPSGVGKRTANWIQNEVIRVLKRRRITIKEFPISPKKLGQLIRRVDLGEITHSEARLAFAKMLEESNES